jgi:hypothetical protein
VATAAEVTEVAATVGLEVMEGPEAISAAVLVATLAEASAISAAVAALLADAGAAISGTVDFGITASAPAGV